VRADTRRDGSPKVACLLVASPRNSGLGAKAAASFDFLELCLHQGHACLVASDQHPKSATRYVHGRTSSCVSRPYSFRLRTRVRRHPVKVQACTASTPRRSLVMACPSTGKGCMPAADRLATRNVTSRSYLERWSAVNARCVA
jgi:hypothetical protein